MPMSDAFPTIKGKIDSYDIIVIGHLKWNPYFHETADAPPRGDPSTCTSTMLRGTDSEGRPYVLLVDPTLRLSPEDYYFDINRRTGLSASDVTHCFITHEHYDHQAGVNYFPHAVWLAAPPVAERLRGSEHIDGTRVQTVEGEFLPGVSTVPLPGHTESLHGIAFLTGGMRAVAAGDGVMTKNHFAGNTTMFEQDVQQAVESIRWLKRNAELIIPGHDNLVINRLPGKE